MIDDNDIAKFRDLYRTRFGIELNEETARRKLVLLVTQMEAVYQPIKLSDVEYVNGDEYEREVATNKPI